VIGIAPFNLLRTRLTHTVRFCESCLEVDSTRVITSKAPARKSSRKRTHLDYANLDSGLQSDPNRWTRILEGKTIKDDNFKRMQGSEVGLEWLECDDSAMREPFVVETPEGLGMKMPDEEFSVDDVAEMVGDDTPVEVIGTRVLFSSFCVAHVSDHSIFQTLHLNPTLLVGR
jgi:hypothetical protein